VIMKIGMVKQLAFALLLTSGAVRGELLLDINGIHFGPGDTLDISLGFSDTENQTVPVDLYFAVLFPDGNTVLFISGDALAPVITPGKLTDPATWTPLEQGVMLKDMGNSDLMPYLSATLPDDTAAGDYQIAFAAIRAGTQEIMESQIIVMRILENSIRSNIGYFVGSWDNTTFDSTGIARFRIREVAPGMLEYTIDLDGFVDGDDDPFPLVRDMPLADFSGNVDFTTDDPLFAGPVTNTLSTRGNYSYSIENVGIEGLGAFNAAGKVGAFWLDLDFQVDSTFGMIVGSVLAARRPE